MRGQCPGHEQDDPLAHEVAIRLVGVNRISHARQHFVAGIGQIGQRVNESSVEIKHDPVTLGLLSLHRRLLEGDGPVEITVGNDLAANVTRPACYDYPHRFSFLA